MDFFLFMLLVPFTVGIIVGKNYGVWTGIIAALLSAVPCAASVVLFYRSYWRKAAQRREALKSRYTRIYRVQKLPTDGATKIAQGASIKIGDYGWEAVPLRDDSLIYLQGLDTEWKVIWHAGFHPEQIESVATKPQSQYDWNYEWVRKKLFCPFPVQEHSAASMGFPI